MNDGVQFARLLSEIMACCDLSDSMQDLCESMDLEEDEIMSIFERAEVSFEKQKHAQTVVAEIGKIPVLLPCGGETELALLSELDTGSIFAVEGSFIEQDNDVESPYGSGLLKWADLPAKTLDSKFSHTVIRFEVLSDDPDFDAGDYSIGDLAREADNGCVVARASVTHQYRISPERMAETLIDFGSDPGFFSIDIDPI